MRTDMDYNFHKPYYPLSPGLSLAARCLDPIRSDTDYNSTTAAMRLNSADLLLLAR